MRHPFRRLVLALALLNVHSGHAARKQTLLDSQDRPAEAGDAIDATQEHAGVGERAAPELSGVATSAPTGAQEAPRATGERGADATGSALETSQVDAPELPQVDGGRAASGEPWPPRAWLSLLSALTAGTVTDLSPVDALSAVFTLSCAAYSFWITLRYGYDSAVVLRLQVMENQRHRLQKACDAFTGGAVETLNALSESVALIAERSFEGRRRHCLKVIRRIRDHPDRVGSSSECAPAFKQLVSEWLAVFRECDLNVALSSEEVGELAEGSTVDRMAVIACERLESTGASEITRELGSFMGPLTQQGVKALENTMKSGAFPMTVGCDERLCFTLLSVSHAVGLLAVLLGLVLAGAVTAERRLWLATVVLCADACLFLVLLRQDKIDKMRRLEGEVRRLRLESRVAQRRHEQVGAFFKKAEAVTHLWLHRTMPQLEIFGGLFDLLWGELAGSADVTQFPVLAEKLARMRGRLGPLHAWCGEEAIHNDDMQAIGGVLCDCADFIKTQPDDAKPECLLEIIKHLDKMQFPNSAQEAQR